MTAIFDQAHLAGVIGFDRPTLERVETAYTWLRKRSISMPPVFHIDIDDDSAVDVKGAYVEGLDSFAIKMATGFYRNADLGLPSSSSVILLISAKTGLCQAVFLDDGYIMNLRTALAGAVAAKHLARPDVSRVGIVGTGVQARAQLQALRLVRDFSEVFVWGRHADKAMTCATDMATLVNVPVRAVDDLEYLVRSCDLIVTTTQTSDPLIDGAWVNGGTHITAMGSDLPGKQELSQSMLHLADQIVCDDIAQCAVGGELQHVDQAFLKRPATDLAGIVTGATMGRRGPDDITICDMTGVGVLDTAVSLAAFERLSAD